jgi:hypothetical protein
MHKFENIKHGLRFHGWKPALLHFFYIFRLWICEFARYLTWLCIAAVGHEDGQPTPSSGMFFRKRILFQIANICITFDETRKLIVFLARSRHLSLSWARWIRSTPSHSSYVYKIKFYININVIFCNLTKYTWCHKLAVVCPGFQRRSRGEIVENYRQHCL